MMIMKQTVAEKLAAYLRHELSLERLVDWAEDALMECEFDDENAPILAAVIGRLGVADTRAFGLAWEDCESLLRDLGYEARVEIAAR